MTSFPQLITKEPSSDPTQRYLLGFACWVVGCLALPVVLLSGHEAPLPTVLTFAQLLLLLYAGTRLSTVIASKQLAPLVAIFWLFTYVAMGLAPLAQITSGIRPVGLQEYDTLIPATALILVGCLAFDVGNWVAVSKPSRSGFAIALGERIVVESRLILLSVFSVLACSYYVMSIGGPLEFFVSRESLGDAVRLATGVAENSQAGSATFRAVGQIPVLVAFLCWVAKASPLRRASYTELSWLLLLGSLNAIVNNPISNARFWFLTVLIAILFISPGVATKHFRAVLVGGVIAAVVVFPVSDIFRYNEGNGGAAAASQSVTDTFAGKDFDQTVMTANGMWWVDSRGAHTFGKQLSGDLLFWVPRALWPAKPTDTGVEIGSAMQLASTNLSSPLWIEAWVDFGWGGVVVTLFLLGTLAARADAAYQTEHRRRGRSLSFVGLLLPLLAGYELIVLRGPLLQAMGALVAMVAVAWVVTARDNVEPSERLA